MYLEGCDRATSFEKAKDDIKYAWVYSTFTAFVILFLFLLFMLNVGFQKAMVTIFYIISFHWLFKQIANAKEGNSFNKQFKEKVHEMMHNDEEIADAVCDTGHDEIELEGDETAD